MYLDFDYFIKIPKEVFLKTFKAHYRPGLTGGHFGKNPRTRDSILARAKAYPNSATAYACVLMPIQC